jgi:HEAT repeat protein
MFIAVLSSIKSQPQDSIITDQMVSNSNLELPTKVVEHRKAILSGRYGNEPINKVVDTLIATEGDELQDVFLALKLRKQETLNPLLGKLDSGTPYEKRKVTKFLRVVRWNDAVPKLLNIATSDEEHELSRISALYTLGSVGNKDVAPSLVPLLNSNRTIMEKELLLRPLHDCITQMQFPLLSHMPIMKIH